MALSLLKDVLCERDGLMHAQNCASTPGFQKPPTAAQAACLVWVTCFALHPLWYPCAFAGFGGVASNLEMASHGI